MGFLKKHGIGTYSPFISLLFISCASRGPSYAAREELYEKTIQSGVVEKVAHVQEAILPANFEDQEKLEVSKPKKSYRSISSQKVIKKTKPFSKVVVDDLDLNIVPATSSSNGKGFLLNE